MLPWVRLGLYFAVTVAFGSIAATTLKIKNQTARTFGIVAVALCLNFGYWAFVLLTMILTGVTIPSFELFSTIAIGVVAVAAIVFLVRFPNGRSDY